MSKPRYRPYAREHPYEFSWWDSEKQPEIFDLDEVEKYRRAKKEAQGKALKSGYECVLSDPTFSDLESEVLETLLGVLREEYADFDPYESASERNLYNFMMAMPPDLAVIEIPEDDDAKDRVVYLHVCLPTGWRPEKTLGASFSAIHHRIPIVPESAALAGRRKLRELASGDRCVRRFEKMKLKSVPGGAHSSWPGFFDFEHRLDFGSLPPTEARSVDRPSWGAIPGSRLGSEGWQARWHVIRRLG